MGVVLFYRKRDGNMLDIMNMAAYIYAKDPRMSHKKLQKLCFYCQAWYIAFNGKKLVDCEFEAWVHGPVCRKLYSNRNSVGKEASNVQIQEEEKQFIDGIYKLYENYSGYELELMTHNDEPWKKARGELQSWEPSNSVISIDSIKEYYGSIVHRV